VKHLKTAIIAAAVGAVLAPAAQAQLSANIGAVSNYMWRGVTQTDDGPAIQGGVDYGYEGFFVGAWASNVKFIGTQETTVLSPSATPGDPPVETVITSDVDLDASVEVDLYAGYGGSIDDFSYKGGVYFYTYPGGGDVDFVELGVSGAYQVTKEVSLGLAFNYTVNGEAKNDLPFNQGDYYIQANANFTLPMDFGLGITYGFYEFNDANVSYPWAGASLTKTAGDFGTFGLNVSQAWGDVNAITLSGPEDLKVWVSWLKTF
jgi:hypothetical protein